MTTTALVFQNTEFSIVARNNQPWLRLPQIGAALGYAQSHKVQKVYDRHADEFTDSMTALVKIPDLLPQTGATGQMREVRVFSLRGAHLLAMLSRTAVAKEFRKWVLDILDKEIEKTMPFSVGIHDSLTKEQADSLRDMVKRNADKLEKPYQGAFCVKAWAKLKAHFKCGYRDIPRGEYTTALSILSRHIVDYGLELEAPKTSELTTSELTKEYVAMCHRKAVTAGNSISSAILQMLLEGKSEELDIEAFRITFAGGTPWVSRLPMLR